MDAYRKTLRDVPDDGLADLIAEREFLEQCTGLERELIVRWLARDMIEWLQAELRLRASQVPGLGRDHCEWPPRASVSAPMSAVCPRRPVGDPAPHGA